MPCRAHYAQEMDFKIIKQDGHVVGFTIVCRESASEEVKHFCLNLMAFYSRGTIAMDLPTKGKSLIIYTPREKGENRKINEKLIKLPIGQSEEVKQLKKIIFAPEATIDVSAFNQGQVYGFKLTVAQ